MTFGFSKNRKGSVLRSTSRFPPWDLNLVLSKLTGPPFELLASCSLLLLLWKVIFLVAITSARKVFEIKAFTSEASYTIFFNKVQLRLYPAFLPKVASHFHSNQIIFLPVFFLKTHKNSEEQQLHMLDVRCSLIFYIKRTKPFCKFVQLFLAVEEGMRAPCVSTENLVLDNNLYPSLLQAGRCSASGHLNCSLHKGSRHCLQCSSHRSQDICRAAT